MNRNIGARRDGLEWRGSRTGPPDKLVVSFGVSRGSVQSADSSPFDADRVAARRGRGLRLLVVEDDPSLRRSLERYLGGVGFEVVVASDVDEALDRLAGGIVSAVILDVRMPDPTGRHRTGLEVLSYVRLQPQLSSVPVIVFTGFTPTPEQILEISRNRGEILLKGQSYSELVGRLDRLLQV